MAQRRDRYVASSTAARHAEQGCDVVIADVGVDEANATPSTVKDKGRDGPRSTAIPPLTAPERWSNGYVKGRQM